MFKERIGKDFLDHYAVSTCDTYDNGLETAVSSGSGWHVVERYESKEEACSGHERWVEKLRVVTGPLKVRSIGGDCFGMQMPDSYEVLQPRV